jgi:putative acyl-CoA dehydrogenase
MPTHEVFNQSSAYADVDLFEADAAMRGALAFVAPALDIAPLAKLGRLCGSARMQEHARLANVHTPELRTHDTHGRRIDQVEFHPSYHALMQGAMEAGLHATPWAGGAGAHVTRAAGFMLYTQLEPSVMCPVSMTYAVAPALRANPAITAAWMPGLTARAYDPRFAPASAKGALTMGMGMTEKQGGSDVRANTTQARHAGRDAWGDVYELTGHKWFMSAPMCDGFLVLAQAASDGRQKARPDPTCFFLPRWLPDGTVNPIRIQRLKDKLGNRANASSEVEFEGARAWRVGEEGRGIPRILAMGALTRLDCALGTAGLMRGALSLAVHHARERMAFGRHLAEHAMMKAVLADLALESEAATVLALRLAHAIDVTETPDDGARPAKAPARGEASRRKPTPAAPSPSADPAHEAALRRVLTPLAKFWICKRGSAFAQEAMECLGGNGYVEDGGRGAMARIYREMPLNSIWEGAANIMGLDLLRALRDPETVLALMTELAPLAGAHADIDRLLRGLPDRLDGGTGEAQARLLARDVALLVQASLLRRCAPGNVFETFCAARLRQGCDVFGALPNGVDVDAIVRRAMP